MFLHYSLYVHPICRHFLTPTSATRVRLSGSLDESLGLKRELVTLLRQVVQLLAPVEDGRDGVVEDDFGLVHLALHLRHGVDGRGVLVLLEVDVERADESLHLMGRDMKIGVSARQCNQKCKFKI